MLAYLWSRSVARWKRRSILVFGDSGSLRRDVSGTFGECFRLIVIGFSRLTSPEGDGCAALVSATALYDGSMYNTTFSSFSLQTLSLIQDREWLRLRETSSGRWYPA
jgi:hypothetical protein